MGSNPLSNVDPDGDYFFGLFGSNKKMRDDARAFAAQTGGDVQNIIRRDIYVNYNTYQLKDGIFEVYNRNQYFREDGRLDFKNSIQNSGYDEELARTPQKPYPGTVEYVPIEMALLPASLPFRASSSLGKAALFTAEVANPISGLGGSALKTAASVPDGKYFSVAFEMELSPTLYPGKGYGTHFRAANRALNAAMESDSRFKAMMGDLKMTFKTTPTGAVDWARSPNNFVWHHNIEKGIMQLVPNTQHTNGSIFWKTLHPNGAGGMKL